MTSALLWIVLASGSYVYAPPAVPVMDGERDQRCEDQTDTRELDDLSPDCRAWLYEGDTTAEGNP